MGTRTRSSRATSPSASRRGRAAASSASACSPARRCRRSRRAATCGSAGSATIASSSVAVRPRRASARSRSARRISSTRAGELVAQRLEVADVEHARAAGRADLPVELVARPGRGNSAASSRSSLAIWSRSVRRAAPSSTSTSNGASGAGVIESLPADRRPRTVERARRPGRAGTPSWRPCRASASRTRAAALSRSARQLAGVLGVLDRRLERHQPLAHHARRPRRAPARGGRRTRATRRRRSSRRGRPRAPCSRARRPSGEQDLLDAAADAGRRRRPPR